MASLLKVALRQLAKSTGYTALAIGALALGIGANTILFSAINALFLRPLPYREPDSLIRVWGSFRDRGLEKANVSWPRFQALAEQQQCFSKFAAHAFTQFTLTGRGDPEQLAAMRVTGDFFGVLGVEPVVGRTFTAAEQAAGGASVVLLSYGYWQRRFGGSGDIVGQTLVLDGVPHTVIGVLPAYVSFPWQRIQVWAPRVFQEEGIPPELIERGTGFLFVFGRLRPGIAVAQAREQLTLATNRYGAAHPEKVDAKTSLVVLPWLEDLVGDQRPRFLTLFVGVGCVLLVACANVANLLLARFTSRRKDTAIRLALGATRGRIAAQFLMESVLTAVIAGMAGVLIALWGMPVLVRTGQDFAPRLAEARLEPLVLGFALLLSLVTGGLLGVVPAWQASRTDPHDSLKDSTRGSTTGRQRGRMRAVLLVSEVALSMVLLVGAALLMNSFRRLQQVDPGFRAEGVTVFGVGLPAATYPDNERRARFFETLAEKLTALPGVERASGSTSLPIDGGGGARSPAAVEGRPLPPVAERVLALRSTISPGFFATLGIPVKQGRDFTWRDRSGEPNVVIINQTLARQLFPNENPIGHRLITGIASVPREIVGVAGDVRSESMALTPGPEMYYPAAQIDGAALNVVVKSSRPAASLRPEIISVVHAIDAGLPVAEVNSYTDLLAQAVADRRVATWLLGGFAITALVLAGMGLYSVIAYGVAQRTNEFGIRVALGADAKTILSMVIGEGLKLTAIGLGIGLVMALGVTRLISNQLFEVSATDPVILIGVALFLLLVAAVACLLPARAATKVDPIIALRTE